MACLGNMHLFVVCLLLFFLLFCFLIVLLLLLLFKYFFIGGDILLFFLLLFFFFVSKMLITGNNFLRTYFLKISVPFEKNANILKRVLALSILMGPIHVHIDTISIGRYGNVQSVN